MLILELSLSSSLTVSGQGSLTTIGELLNISTLDPLLPTFLITTLCLCVLSVIFYYPLVVAWEVFWASQQSPSPLDPSAEVVLTEEALFHPPLGDERNTYGRWINLDVIEHLWHMLQKEKEKVPLLLQCQFVTLLKKWFF